MGRRFKCLGGLTLVEAKLTDHEPILDGGVCVLNLMCLGNGKNNSFGFTETPDQYRIRLAKLVEAIKELKESDGIDVFMFQEAPKYNSAEDPTNLFYRELQKIPGFEKLNPANITPTQNTRSAMFTIADYDRFPIQSNTTINSPLGIHGRFQELQLTSADGRTISTINVHGDWTQQQATKKAIMDSTNLPYPTIIGGDFNVTSGIDDVMFGQKGIYQKADLFQTCDGLLSSTTPVAALVPIGSRDPVEKLIVDGKMATQLLNKFKATPLFLQLGIPLNHKGFIPGINLSSPPGLIEKNQALITISGPNSHRLKIALESFLKQENSKAHTKGTEVTSTNQTVESAKEDFYSKHNELYKEQRAHCLWGFFRNTKIKPSMSLQEIISHAQSSNNRSREVCVSLGWMNNKGKLTPQIEALIEEENKQVFGY
ncbi:endonuclease/exonuclease/phosphatase family protein [Legionella cardiaca]|uniref:Endonuclease/exonuclease/phosphatase domain-containing protein n=1 Tax=Legionella cardiaca TaxID=1071983 RepID=A0ABY8AP61_9GAMM|nr:hypothetical protein [Legionella cardiaca]WED42041.1 hypothetical protein PXX05_08855 [Legionella cardiaca]